MTTDKPRVDARPQTSTGPANPADTAGRAEVRADEIVPDDKDWTWVLERPCPECGLDLPSVEAVDVSAMIRANVDAWRLILTDASTDLEAVALREVPNRWSTLEYGCHVRDVYKLFGVRLHLMMTEEDPEFANWNPDDPEVTAGYARATPSEVAADLVQAGLALADRFGSIHGAEWDRRGRRSDGADFTVASFAKYLIHDPVHHLHDVGYPSG